MLKRRTFTALAVMAGATAATGARAKSITLTLGSTGLLYIPVYTAEQMKLWDAVGTPVELLNINSGSRLAAALVSGDTDVTVQSITPSFLARMRGSDTICIGGVINQMASNLVVSKAYAASHGINPGMSYAQKLAALKGARIGITSPGSGSDAVAKFLVREAKLDPERDVTLVTLGGTAGMVPALANGSIDALTASPPVPDIAVSQFGAVTLFDLVGGEVESLNGFMYQGVLVKQAFLKAYPKEAVNVLRGLQRALDVIHDPAQTEKARDIVWKAYYSSMNKGLFDTVWQSMAPAFPKTVELSQAQLDQVLLFERAGGAVISEKAAREGWTNDVAAAAVKAERGA